jgi:hypothetical protein
LVEPYAGLSEDDNSFEKSLFRVLDGCTTQNYNYQRNETELLQDYTQTRMEENTYTQDIFPATSAEGNNIDYFMNFEMSDDFGDGEIGPGLIPINDTGLVVGLGAIDSTGGFGDGGTATDSVLLGNDTDLFHGLDAIDSTHVFDDGGMAIDSVPHDTEAVAGGTEDVSATGSNKHNPSEVDDNG